MGIPSQEGVTSAWVRVASMPDVMTADPKPFCIFCFTNYNTQEELDKHYKSLGGKKYCVDFY